MLFPKVNFDLLPMKSHYFCTFAATGAVWPYVAVYLKQLGISSSTTGIIFLMVYISGMMAKTILGFIADKFKCKRFLFLFTEISTCIAFAGFFLIPGPKVKQNAIIDSCQINNGTFNFILCSNDFESNEKCDQIYFYKKLINLTSVHFTFKCDSKMYQNENLCNHNYSSAINKLYLTKESDQERCLVFPVEANFTKCPEFHSQYTLDTNSLYLNNFILNPFTNQEVVQFLNFWLICLFLCISWVSIAVVVSFGDAFCIELLGDKPNDYGKQRLWGSLGWGICVLLTGILIDVFSDPNSISKNYLSALIILTVMSIMDVSVSLKLKIKSSKNNDNLFKKLSINLCNLKVVCYFSWCIIIGFFTSLTWSFLYWHLETLTQGCESKIDQSWIKTLEGLVGFIQCFAGEVPFLALSGIILKKIGHINAMHLVSLCFSVRLFLYSMLTNPWWCLPIECMNGITFGLYYAIMTSYTYSISSPGTETTMQGLSGAMFEGIGVGFGSLICGELINNYGSAFTFKLNAYIGIIFTIIHCFVQKCFIKDIYFAEKK